MAGILTPRMRLLAGPLLFAAVTLAACGGGSSTPESTPAPRPRRPIQPVTPLITTPLAGQPVSVLPLTLLVAADSVVGDSTLKDHMRSLAWADSLIAEAVATRATEVKWVLPPELRKVSKRAAGVAPDPDHMGQSIMRASNLKQVPDPLRSSLRTLVALAGGRYALIPAALVFSKEPDGQVRAEISMVMADARNGMVIWRTIATGFAGSPPSALVQALDTMLPVSLGLR